MTTMLYILIAVTALWQGVHAFQWTNTSMANESTIYLCQEANITLEWQHVDNPNELIRDIHWRFNRSVALVAMYAFEHWVPIGSYTPRTTRLGNAGVTITGAKPADSGNYSVEIQLMQANGNFLFQRMIVIVRVFDNLMTTDGQLHVTQGQHAILDPRTNRYVVPLTCGDFVFGNNPPYDVPPFPVEWLNSVERIVPSSDFLDHRYRLFIDGTDDGMDVSNYECRIPSLIQRTKACVPNMLPVEPRITINKMAIRVSLLEKELQDSLSLTNSTLRNMIQEGDDGLADRVEKLKVRLVVGAANGRFGRLEYLYNGIWGTVCDDAFNTNAAMVVCRQLGFPTNQAVFLANAHYGQGTGPIHLDDVNCRGDERYLDQCPHQAVTTHNCGHQEDVSVQCN